jgi:hypothetical protein
MTKLVVSGQLSVASKSRSLAALVMTNRDKSRAPFGRLARDDKRFQETVSREIGVLRLRICKQRKCSAQDDT